MAETIRYTCAEPAVLLYSSVTEKSAPRDTPGATPKFSATLGLVEIDFKAIVDIMVRAIQGELGEFTNPGDYYLACMSGTTAAKRAIETADFKSRGKPADEVFKLKEKAEKRAELYRQYAGVVTASSQYDIELAKLEGGRIIDIPTEGHARAQAGKDLFYPGATVVPALAFKAFRRKKMDDKDGCTGYLQNLLHIRKTPRIAGGGAPSNNEVFGSYKGYSAEDPTALAPDGSGGETKEPAAQYDF